MKVVQRLSTLAAIFLLASGSLAAFDWGGSLVQSNTLKSVPPGAQESGFLNNTTLSGYLSAKLGSYSEVVLGASAKLGANPFFSADIEQAVLRRSQPLQGIGPVLFAARLGRFMVSDPSGYVVSTTIDGGEFDLRYRNFSLLLGAGYTGLVTKGYSGAGMSRLDNNDAANSRVLFGPARMVGQARLSIPNVAAGHGLTVAMFFQEDLRDPATTVRVGTAERTASSGGLLDTQYLILRGTGPVIADMYYSAAYVLNTGRTLSYVPDTRSATGSSYQYQPILAHLVRLQLDYFYTSFLDSVFGFGVTFGSGDPDYTTFTEGNAAGNATMYTPITPYPAGTVFALQPGNTTTIEVSYALRPFMGLNVPVIDKSQTEASLLVFMRNAAGPVSAQDVAATFDGNYLGSEIDFAWRFRPLSDVGFGISGGLFIGNPAALSAQANAVDFVLRVEASLSF